MTHISYVDPAIVDDPELQAIMERARVYGTPRSTEAQVDEILDFERSERFDERERTALEWTMAIAPADRAGSLHRPDARTNRGSSRPSASATARW